MTTKTITRWTHFLNACGRLLSRLILFAVIAIILALMGKYVISREAMDMPEPDPIASFSRPSVAPDVTPMASIPAPILWDEVNQALIKALRQAHNHAEQVASEHLDVWIDSMMQRVDGDFLEWYFGYWNQQVLGLKGLWYWTLDHLFTTEESAATRITAEIQTELTKRVLRPPIAQLELERIAREVVNQYVQELSTHINAIPQQYNIPQAAWQRHLADLAVMTSNVEGDRRVDLSLKTLTATGAGGAVLLAKQLQVVGGKLGSKVAAKFAGKTAAKVAAKSGGKIAASMGGKMLGPIVGFGIIIWDLWDHHATKITNKPLLRDTIVDYFAEVKDALLHDPEAGVMAVVHTIDQNVMASLRSMPSASTEEEMPGRSSVSDQDQATTGVDEAVQQ